MFPAIACVIGVAVDPKNLRTTDPTGNAFDLTKNSSSLNFFLRFKLRMNLIDLTSPAPVPSTTSEDKSSVFPLRMDPLDELPVKDDRLCVELEGSTSNAKAGAPSRCSLTRSQQTIVDMAVSGTSLFFTGCAGTGKTFTLRSVIDALSPGSTFVTAMTGIAASLLPNGTTLHSFVGFGHGDGTKEVLLKKVKSNKRAVKNWRAAKTLIIDEVSMLSSEMFETIDYIGREIRNRPSVPFGGVQVICCGDFFQLPPVSRKSNTTVPVQYCFTSPLWVSVLGNSSFELTRIFRQKDQKLIDLLNDIRYGTMSAETTRLIQSLRREISLPSGIVPTMLVPINSTADSINHRELERLPPTASPLYEANDWALDPFTQDLLPKLTLFPDRLFLRVGAQVMLLKNKPDFKLFNGSRGVVIGFREKKYIDPTKIGYIGCTSTVPTGGTDLLPLVRFADGQEVIVGPDSFEMEGVGGQSRVRARRIQLPLRLSWAITIHKSQGMSLDFLKVDASRSFEAGQAYVALSRARTIEGLQVLAFDPRKCWCDQTVADFYREGIQKLSDENENDENANVAARRKRSAEWISKNPPVEILHQKLV